MSPACFQRDEARGTGLEESSLEKTSSVGDTPAAAGIGQPLRAGASGAFTAQSLAVFTKLLSLPFFFFFLNNCRFTGNCENGMELSPVPFREISQCFVNEVKQDALKIKTRKDSWKVTILGGKS